MKKITTTLAAFSAVVASLCPASADGATFQRLERMDYDEYGEYYEFAYDENNRLVTLNEFNIDRLRTEYTYNEKGECVRELTWQEMPLSSGKYYEVTMVDYTYDEEGRLATRTNYNRPNATNPASQMLLEATAYYTYNDKSDLASIEFFWGAEKVDRIFTDTYEYDNETGRLASKRTNSFLAGREIPSSLTVYSYDAEGRLILERNEEADEENNYDMVVRSWVNYVYAEDGNLIECYRTGATNSPDNKQDATMFMVDEDVPASDVIYPVVPEPMYGSQDWDKLVNQIVEMDKYTWNEGERVTLALWEFSYEETSAIGSVQSNFGKSLSGVTVSGDCLLLHGVAGVESLRVYDIEGRLVKSLSNCGNKVDISGLANGVYVVATPAGISKFIR